MQTIDLIGALLAFISAMLYIKEKPSAWLISLIAIPFDAVMDLNLNIFGDLLLQLLYCALLIHGWYRWNHSEEDKCTVSITHITHHQAYLASLTAIVMIIFAWQTLLYFSPSDISLLDASVTCLSVIGMYLLSKKIIEAWALWIFIDVLYVTLYATQNMPLHALMALFDASMCVIGLTMWIKEHHKITALPLVPVPLKSASTLAHS